MEPFSTITVICSGTEYQNFFDQRCHPDAQPEMQALANKMKFAYDTSIPRELNAGDWHIPLTKPYEYENEYYNLDDQIQQVGIGRCARVSFLNQSGNASTNDDLALYNRLVTSKPAHLTPLEHVAIALSGSEKRANYTGFESYRFNWEKKFKRTCP